MQKFSENFLSHHRSFLFLPRAIQHKIYIVSIAFLLQIHSHTTENFQSVACFRASLMSVNMYLRKRRSGNFLRSMIYFTCIGSSVAVERCTLMHNMHMKRLRKMVAGADAFDTLTHRFCPKGTSTQKYVTILNLRTVQNTDLLT